MICDEKVGTLATEEGPPPAERHQDRRKVRRGLNDQAQKRLGLHLRAMYESVVQQPVPDRFKELVARLDDQAGDAETV